MPVPYACSCWNALSCVVGCIEYRAATQLAMPLFSTRMGRPRALTLTANSWRFSSVAENSLGSVVPRTISMTYRML